MARNLSVIIRGYQRLKARNPDTWKQHCQNQNSLSNAIRVATSCRDANNRKHPHQYRLTQRVLTNFEQLLINNIAAIRQCVDFDSLYNYIHGIKPWGIGDLTAYDVAVRIGAFLGFDPAQIYLHAGTRIGAEKLLGKINSSTIPKNNLPPILRNSPLSCYELEDMLCIYKKEF